MFEFFSSNSTYFPIERIISFIHAQNFKAQLGIIDNKIPENMQSSFVINNDNNKIELVWCECKNNPPKGIIIFCHPFLKHGMSYFFIMKFYNYFLNHYHVVFFNFRGFGKSTYSPYNFTNFESDIMAVTHWCQEKYPNLAKYLYGCSFGGYWACRTAATNPGHFSALIIDSAIMGPTRKAADNWSEWAILWSSHLITPPLTKYLTHIGVPILYLYGKNDKMIPPEDISLMQKSNSKIEFVAFNDCDHLEACRKHLKMYPTKISDFLNAHTVQKLNYLPQSKL